MRYRSFPAVRWGRHAVFRRPPAAPRGASPGRRGAARHLPAPRCWGRGDCCRGVTFPGGLRRSGQPPGADFWRWARGRGVAPRGASRAGCLCRVRGAGRPAVARSVSRGRRRPFLRREEGTREGAAAGGDRPRLSPPVGRAAAWESAGLPGGGVLGGENKGPPAGAGRSSAAAPGMPATETGVEVFIKVSPPFAFSGECGCSLRGASSCPAAASATCCAACLVGGAGGAGSAPPRDTQGGGRARVERRGVGAGSPGRAGGEGSGRVRLPSRWFLHPQTVKTQLQAVQIAGVN